MPPLVCHSIETWCLNESPSEKEGKLPLEVITTVFMGVASMKVPPKRKGNFLKRGGNMPATIAAPQ